MYKINDLLMIEHVEENTLVIDTERQKVFQLGKNESTILDLALKYPMETIVDRIKSEYKGDNIENSVRSYLNRLQRLGIIISC